MAAFEDNTSDLELKDKKARYDWNKPIDKMAFYASVQSGLLDHN
jgi:hypothetical protein